jgi:hypothetical protein
VSLRLLQPSYLSQIVLASHSTLAYPIPLRTSFLLLSLAPRFLLLTLLPLLDSYDDSSLFLFHPRLHSLSPSFAHNIGKIDSSHMGSCARGRERSRFRLRSFSSASPASPLFAWTPSLFCLVQLGPVHLLAAWNDHPLCHVAYQKEQPAHRRCIEASSCVSSQVRSPLPLLLCSLARPVIEPRADSLACRAYSSPSMEQLCNFLDQTADSQQARDDAFSYIQTCKLTLAALDKKRLGRGPSNWVLAEPPPSSLLSFVRPRG